MQEYYKTKEAAILEQLENKEVGKHCGIHISILKMNYKDFVKATRESQFKLDQTKHIRI